MKNPVILIVNANRSELETLAKELEEEGYVTAGASSLEEMGSVIKRQKNIKLALLDLAGFDKGIWERCDRLHEAKIPFIVILPPGCLLIMSQVIIFSWLSPMIISYGLRTRLASRLF